MKKVTFFKLITASLILIAVSAKAQTNNYFIGKWDVLLKGLPQGDTHVYFNIADSAGTLKSVLLDTTSAHKNIPVTKIEQKGDDITLYFTAMGNDVSLSLTKKDADHANGSLMGMFDAVAIRKKD